MRLKKFSNNFNLIAALLCTFQVSFLGFDTKSLYAENLKPSHLKFFETKIRPVLANHCYKCHSGKAKKLGANLKLDYKDGLIKGGESGSVINLKKPNESLILKALLHTDGLEMPPEEKLSPAIVADFRRWIEIGAPDPRKLNPKEAKNKQSLPWSFNPVKDYPIPKVKNESWPQDSLDHYILARMEKAQLNPTQDASPEVLIRRLYVDLIGLQPSFQEIVKFKTAYLEKGEAALKALVDHLLTSSQFGERWGRHWLDIARYGESNGNDGLGRNPTFPHAWRYRDYVIDAFNRDTPYDRFIKEQIAGDLLPYKTVEERNRNLVGTGFLALGWKPALAMNQNFEMDVVNDQIDTISTAFMGLSVACARCHDHKHDPIPTKDYYSLAGIFKSTQTMWGLAANEKLTAPATPLHKLVDSLDETKNSNTKAITFPGNYEEAIRRLKPAIYSSLKEKPATLITENKVTFSKSEHAVMESGRFRVEREIPRDNYSVSFWFRNDVGNTARPITAYLFSHAKNGDKQQEGDHIGIGGKHDAKHTGKLYFWNGQKHDQLVGSSTILLEGTWNHLVLTRSGEKVRLYLNGVEKPEIEAQFKISAPEGSRIFVGARNDQFSPLKGGLAHLAIFERALNRNECLSLHRASGHKRGTKQVHFAMGARDKAKIEDCKINIDGNSRKLGPSTPRGVLTSLGSFTRPPKMPKTSSGRLELAEWLTHPQHPQTSRVMVNRVWHHLFGQTLVSTVDDFGSYGEKPTHPELLDHLALQFIKNDWSVKLLIRKIVLSRTYRLSSDPLQKKSKVRDTNNIHYSRHLRRRLDAESLRDSILQACSTLNLKPGQESAVAKIDKLINWPPGEAKYLHQPSAHRSVYLCMLRNSPPPELAAFDFPTSVRVHGKREITNQPSQALFLLNNPWLIEQSQHYSRKLAQNVALTEVQKIESIFQAILKRTPQEDEIQEGLALVRAVERELGEADSASIRAWASLIQALLASNEFRYID